MANVRTLLRNEKATRRINHPQASYSSAGTLSCLACQLQIKSETLWATHLTSPQHLARLQQPRKPPTAVGAAAPESALTAPPPTASTGNGKKRKAQDSAEGVDGRKRSRPVTASAESSVDEAAEFHQPDPGNELASPGGGISTHSLPTRPSTAVATSAQEKEVDEDEWAAFERDVATPPPDLLPPTALSAAPTITAVPLTAEAIAQRERVESGTLVKERQEAELEGEKEDAARRLEEEFDEMDELEARVRRLREKREKLRQNTVSEHKSQTISREDAKVMDRGSGTGDENEKENNEDEGEEEDDEEDWDTWMR